VACGRAIAGVALVFLSACGEVGAPTGEGYQELPADQVLTGVHQTYTSNGVRSALGVYDSVYRFTDSSKVHLRGVNLRMFDETGQQTATVTSTAGVLNDATNEMTASGNVILVTNDLRRIETEELHYDPNTRRMWSDVLTKMTYNDRVQIGDSFQSDDQFTRVTIQNPRGDVPGLRIRR
jgi:LPS export ABC transporter protein LptC